MRRPKVCILVYPGIQPFHFSIPYTLFGMVLDGVALFEVQLISCDGQPVQSDPWLTLQVAGGLECLTHCDMVIIPGWEARHAPLAPALSHALQQAHANGCQLVGLCYGAYALAASGLLNGRRAATHWLAEADFSARYPAVNLDCNALYIEQDNIMTSAGTAAALDCCLALVRQHHGARIANQVARVLVIPPHREGGQAQFISQPVAISTQDSRINLLLDYLNQHLHRSHCIDELAARSAMSRRTFTRHFAKATGMSVHEWLLQQRLQKCRDLLESSQLGIEQIANRTGFKTATALRQHFRQKYQVSPSVWRKTFGLMERQK